MKPSDAVNNFSITVVHSYELNNDTVKKSKNQCDALPSPRTLDKASYNKKNLNAY